MYLWMALALWIDALHTYVYEYVHLSLCKIHTYKKMVNDMYVFILPLKQGPFHKGLLVGSDSRKNLSKVLLVSRDTRMTMERFFPSRVIKSLQGPKIFFFFLGSNFFFFSNFLIFSKFFLQF